MAAGRPDDLDPEAWYEAAIRIDQNQAANAAFRLAHQPLPQLKPLTTRFTQSSLSHPNFPQTPAGSSSRQNFPSRFAHAQPTPGNPVPMDVDKLDVRNLNRDTVEALLQKLNARWDEMNLASSEPPNEESEEAVSEEDFPESSK